MGFDSGRLGDRNTANPLADRELRRSRPNSLITRVGGLWRMLPYKNLVIKLIGYFIRQFVKYLRCISIYHVFYR